MTFFVSFSLLFLLIFIHQERLNYTILIIKDFITKNNNQSKVKFVSSLPKEQGIGIFHNSNES